MSPDTVTRVWLVEDNESYLKAVSRSLGRASGIACERQCRSAEDVLANLDSARAPDVILLDVQLPGSDGISALPSIRSIAPDSKVIVLTAFDDSEKNLSRDLRRRFGLPAQISRGARDRCGDRGGVERRSAYDAIVGGARLTAVFRFANPEFEVIIGLQAYRPGN